MTTPEDEERYPLIENTTLDAAPVVVTIRTETTSGNAKVHVNVSFGARSLDDALALVRRATDSAPLLKNPIEEGR